MAGTALKLGGLIVGSYLCTLVVSFILTAIVAGATSSWGASRAGNALMALVGVIGLMFLVSAVPVVWGAWRLMRSTGARVTVALGYLAALVPTMLVIALMLMVVFNR